MQQTISLFSNKSGFRGYLKILRTNPYQVVPCFKGTDNRKRVAKFRYLLLNPIQDGD